MKFIDENDKENYHLKRTYFWLKNLPKLRPTNSLLPPSPISIYQGEKSKGKRLYFVEGMTGIKGGNKERAKVRSKTFPGIAKAIAEQWGKLLLEEGSDI